MEKIQSIETVLKLDSDPVGVNGLMVKCDEFKINTPAGSCLVCIVFDALYFLSDNLQSFEPLFVSKVESEGQYIVFINNNSDLVAAKYEFKINKDYFAALAKGKGQMFLEDLPNQIVLKHLSHFWNAPRPESTY